MMLRRLLPVAGLFLLSPFVGEFLLGNVPITELPALPFLAPMYGGGALLVREIARRTGRGWPAILLLAAAYGTLEAGLIDQTLFNPPELDGVTPGAYIPALGFSAANALAFVGGHVIWSIGAPIAIVETFVREERRESPWLGNLGLAIVALIYLGGSWLIFDEIHSTEGFLAAPGQLAGAAVVAVAFVVAAFLLPKHRPAIDRPAPRWWLVGAVALAVSSAYVLRPESWLGVALGLLALAVAAYWLGQVSRRTGWDAKHRLALAGGLLLTYGWLGFVLNDLYGRTPATYVPGQIVLTLCAIALLIAGAVVVRARSGAAAVII
ncbi:hypothetical protein [Flindersiella endophytica]